MIGSILRPNNSGLGILGLEFYEHGLIDKCVLEPNGVYKNYFERYLNYKVGIDKNWEWLLEDIDTLLIFETPFRWQLIREAKSRGIKVILMPMHECFPEGMSKADLYLCSSTLEEELPENPKKRINVPVNTKKLIWRQRSIAHNFIHNAGHGGINGRNGTAELIQAMQYVKSDIRLTIRSQSLKFKVTDPRIDFQFVNYKNYQDLWKDGDVLIFPEKFNGLSLPLQEAFASGLAIITTKKPAFNWLPQDLLLDCKWGRARISREVDIALHNPIKIAKKIDEIAGKDISKYSLEGKKWAENNSWEVLLDQYKQILNI